MLTAGIDYLGVGYMFKQHLLSSLGNAERLQWRSIVEQREPPFVGIQRMGLGLRCQHDPADQVSFSQRAAGLACYKYKAVSRL